MPRKYQLDADVLPALQDAWKVCRNRIGKLPIQSERVFDWVTLLGHFSQEHHPATVTQALSRVCQGIPAVITALSWAEATIGAAG